MLARSVLLAVFIAVMGSASIADEVAPAVQWGDDPRDVLVQLTDMPEDVTLRLVGADHAMGVDVTPREDGWVALRTQWPLLSGVAYEVLYHDGQTRRLVIERDAQAELGPGVVRVSNQNEALPENTLRLYLHFKTPMARGQVQEFVSLRDSENRELPHAFLNLGVELWSRDQTRLTLLFDPGRIKQGVGPNLAIGSPLQANQTFTIVVAEGMEDATGRPIKFAFRHDFDTAEAQRQVIDPGQWSLTHRGDWVSLVFDGPMDEQSALRSLALKRADTPGLLLPDKVEAGAVHWNLGEAGQGQAYDLHIAPTLEDVAGNTLCNPFDTEFGAARACDEVVVVSMESRL